MGCRLSSMANCICVLYISRFVRAIYLAEPFPFSASCNNTLGSGEVVSHNILEREWIFLSLVRKQIPCGLFSSIGKERIHNKLQIIFLKRGIACLRFQPL